MCTISQHVGWARYDDGVSRQVWWVRVGRVDKGECSYPVPNKLTDRQLRKHKKRYMLWCKIKGWVDPVYGYRYGADFGKDKAFYGGYLYNDKAFSKSGFERLYNCRF